MEVSTKVKDPVCGMEISPEDAAGTSEFQRETFYFCSPVCKKNFDANPSKFTEKAAEKVETAASLPQLIFGKKA